MDTSFPINMQFTSISAGRSMFNHLDQAKDGDENNHHELVNHTQLGACHLGAPNSAVDGDLLVPPDSKATDSVAGLREHRGLTGQRLQHL